MAQWNSVCLSSHRSQSWKMECFRTAPRESSRICTFLHAFVRMQTINAQDECAFLLFHAVLLVVKKRLVSDSLTQSRSKARRLTYRYNTPPPHVPCPPNNLLAIPILCPNLRNSCKASFPLSPSPLPVGVPTLLPSRLPLGSIGIEGPKLLKMPKFCELPPPPPPPLGWGEFIPLPGGERRD